MRLSVEVDERVVRDIQSRLGNMSRKAPNVISSALNRAATNVNSNIKKEVRKEYHIKAKDVQDTISKSKATRGNLSAVVKSSGGVIGLDKFKVSPKTVNPKRKRPIKVSVKKGHLKEVMGAFVANINGSKVFERVRKDRLPIRRLFGPSVPQMLKNEEIRGRIENEGQETFHRRLDHEVNTILER